MSSSGFINVDPTGGYSDFGGADLSTVAPNPSVNDYSMTSPGADWSNILNTAGQWGATLTSVATGNPVAVAPTAGGGYRTIGAAGSGFTSSSTSQLLILAVIGIAVFLLLRKD